MKRMSVKDKDWRTNTFYEHSVLGGTFDFELNDWMPSEPMGERFTELRVVDIKEYDPILNDKNLQTARPYEFNNADLNEIQDNPDLMRANRLSPELNIDHVPMIDDKFMLVQEKTYRVYFDFIRSLEGKFAGRLYYIAPTAKALNYGFIMQSLVAVEENYNPVIPFYGNTLGYILSTNLYTPVTVNIPIGSLLAHGMRFEKVINRNI